MSKLFVFGDSYSEQFPDQRTYVNLLCQHYRLELENYSRGGGSLLHLVDAWNQNCNKINKGDQVIVTLTSIDRTRFFPQYEHATQYTNLVHLKAAWIDKDKQLITREERDAFEKYYAYLHQPQQVALWLKSWLFWLGEICRRNDSVPVVMDCVEQTRSLLDTSDVHNIIRTNGSLLESISNREIIDNQYWAACQPVGIHFYDPRLNHMVLDNHKIMFNKIQDCWQNNKTVLDVKEGFLQHILDMACMYDESNLSDKFGDSEDDRIPRCKIAMKPLGWKLHVQDYFL